MFHVRGERVIVDIDRWLVHRGLDESLSQPPRPLKLAGKVVAVASAPDWTYNVLLDDAPVTLPGGEEISVVQGLREDHLTAEPQPSSAACPPRVCRRAVPPGGWSAC